jgi:hypothetical protein
MSRGTFAEKLTFFAAQYTAGDRTGKGGGLEDEDEDIEALAKRRHKKMLIAAKQSAKQKSSRQLAGAAQMCNEVRRAIGFAGAFGEAVGFFRC